MTNYEKKRDEILQSFLGELHKHKCPSHSGLDCANCRGTCMDQTPCALCDKGGIAFKRVDEFKQAIDNLVRERVIEELNRIPFHWETCYDNVKGEHYKKLDENYVPERINQLKEGKE
jgi:hypothetical protein